MRFMIETTFRHEGTPCQGATKMSFTPIDVRATDDPAKVPAYKGDSKWWYKEGKNHRIVNGRIERDLEEREEWFVEFNTLEEFMQFHDSNGGWIQIRPSIANYTIPSILIDGEDE